MTFSGGGEGVGGAGGIGGGGSDGGDGGDGGGDGGIGGVAGRGITAQRMNPPVTIDLSEYQLREVDTTPSGPLRPSYDVPSDVVSVSKPLSVSNTCTANSTAPANVISHLSLSEYLPFHMPDSTQVDEL